MMPASLRALVLGWLVVGCANAGNGGSDAATQPPIDSGARVDAPRVIPDGPTMIDGPPPPDAMIDAPPGGLFCQSNNQCTVSGECCVMVGGPDGICAPGDVILGICLPA
jgi:hypothetical protein